MSPINLDEAHDFLPLFPSESEEVIRERLNTWANEGLTSNDVDEWTDTSPGNFFYLNTQGLVREAAKLYDYIGTEVPAAAHPLWAWGEYLDDHAAVVNIERLAATFSSGPVTFFAPAGTMVEVGVVVVAEPATPDGDPHEFETIESGEVGPLLGAPPNPAAAVASGGALSLAAHYYKITTLAAPEGQSTPTAQVNATAAGSNRKINLTWDAVAGATGYRIYRAASAGGTYSLLAEVDAPTHAYSDDGSATEDAAIQPPGADTTGLQLTLTVESREKGLAEDLTAGAIRLLGTSVEGVTEVLNQEAMRGGSDTESDEALRERLLSAYKGRGPGNIHDYEVWSRAYLGVGRVKVFPIWAGPGTVKVVILDAAGNPVSAEIVAGLQAFLDPVAGTGHGQAPVGATVTVVTAAVVAVDVVATVEFEPGYSLDGVGGTVALRQTISDAISTYLDSIEPGGEVVRQRVIGQIVAVPGVHDVGGPVTLNGGATNITLDDDPAQVAELDDLTLTEGAV